MKEKVKRAGSWVGRHGKKRRHQIVKILVWWIVTMIVGGIASFGLRKILWYVVSKGDTTSMALYNEYSCPKT